MMLVKIQSSISTFKTVEFHDGLNVLVAERHPGSTDQQTRNSAGKTSLVEIIHFLFGADCDKDSLFRTSALINETFTATLWLNGTQVEVTRCGVAPAKIFISQAAFATQDLPLKLDKETGLFYASNTNWRVFLGQLMFGMPSIIEGSDFEESFTPSYRSLFSYFARRRQSGGFSHPERSSEQQQRWDWQVNLSYLFGLNWRLPKDFNEVRKREKTLVELKKAAKAGALGNVIGTAAELRPQVAVAEQKAAKLRRQLDNFEVLDSYRDLTQNAARAKTEMQALGRDIVSLQETKNHLSAALAAETPPVQSDLQGVYAAVGIELPDVAVRRFEEVSKFYSSVVRNRKAHLEREISDISQKLQTYDTQLAQLSNIRSEILNGLEGKGALEDFLALQRDLADLEANAATLRERFKAAEALESESTQLKLDRVDLKRRLQIDHQERSALIDAAVLVVAAQIDELYDDRSGGLVIEATDNGPEFRIHIEGDRGGGISNVEIFCFDLALYELASRFGGPGFLIHDSHLFDGVDERQVARALCIGQKTMEHLGGQYIVTMNSDIFTGLPLPEHIKRDEITLNTPLSDQTETGGLFGFRFN